MKRIGACLAVLLAGVGHAAAQVRVAAPASMVPYVSALEGPRSSQVALTIRPGHTALRELCAVGTRHDIVVSPREISREELTFCAASGVPGVIELPLGTDSLNLVSSRRLPIEAIDSLAIYRALAASLPRSETDCTLVPNRARHWNDVDPRLPKTEIKVVGPSAGTDARVQFGAGVMAVGARQISCLAALEHLAPAFFARAIMIRDDGVFVDGGLQESAIAAALVHLPALGIMGAPAIGDRRQLRAVALDGVAPSKEAVRDGQYRLRREIYLYTTEADLLGRPGVREVVDRWTALPSLGARGTLEKAGLIPHEIGGVPTRVETASGTRAQANLPPAKHLTDSGTSGH